MSTEHHKTTVQRFVERGINRKNMDEFDVFYSPDLIDHALPPNVPQGLPGRKMFASAFFAAFPDLHITIEDLVAEGETVVARQSARGTHRPTK
jgi:predicted ester cyclase